LTQTKDIIFKKELFFVFMCYVFLLFTFIHFVNFFVCILVSFEDIKKIVQKNTSFNLDEFNADINIKNNKYYLEI